MNVLRRKIYAIEQQNVLSLRDGKKLPEELHRDGTTMSVLGPQGDGTQTLHGKG